MEDGYGFGQCAGIAFLENETKQNMSLLINIIKELPGVEKVSVVFVDKDLKNIDLLHDILHVPVLLCQFHVIKSIKTALGSRQYSLAFQSKQTLLTKFKTLLYASSKTEFDRIEAEFLAACTDKFRAYYERN